MVPNTIGNPVLRKFYISNLYSDKYFFINSVLSYPENPNLKNI